MRNVSCADALGTSKMVQGHRKQYEDSPRGVGFLVNLLELLLVKHGTDYS